MIGFDWSCELVILQIKGDNYLFWLAPSGPWMVGETVGADYGGLLNRGTETCPESLTSYWEYWQTKSKSWEEDSLLETRTVTVQTVAIRGKQDVGGACPDPSYEYGGVHCCCESHCCWENCQHNKSGGPVIPGDCLPPGAWWEHGVGVSQAYMNISTIGEKLDGALHSPRQ